MKKKNNIVSYSASEISRLRKQGADLTDWERLDQITDSELKASINKEDDIMTIDWKTVKIGIPHKKCDVHIRLDDDLLNWLKKGGKGYQTRINAILRSYMQSVS